jgi:hypothetical protein
MLRYLLVLLAPGTAIAGYSQTAPFSISLTAEKYTIVAGGPVPKREAVEQK